MNTIRNKNIAIIGGGPGGLTLARLLQMNGASVKVYERDASRNVRVQGATLDLHDDSGLKALRKAGLIDAFNANYRPGADKMCITDQNGTVIYGDEGGGEGEHFRPEIDRGPLRDILLDSLLTGTVVWNSQFVTLQQQADGIEIEFKNGTTVYPDLIIAADGANSKIRPYITPIKPFYSGITVLEGTVYDAENAISAINELLNGGKIFALGNEKTLIVGSKGDGSVSYYAGFKTDEFWHRNCGIYFADKAQVLSWFTKEFSGWAPIWNGLIENAGSALIPRPQYCMPLDQTWEALPNLTMLGDAAHLMPPYAGEGVNMAMLDALELAECLLNKTFPDTHSAIIAYEKQMRARTSEIAGITLEQTASMHSADAIADMLAMFRAQE